MRGLLVVAAAGVIALTGCIPANNGSTSNQLNAASGKLDARALLRTAQAATENTDYEGVMENRVRYGNDWLSSDVRAFFHKPDMWRMEYVTGKMNGMVTGEANEMLWRMDPVTHKVLIAAGHTPRPWEQDKLIEANYNVLSGPSKQLAGRNTLEVDLKPKHQGSPSRRYWVDSDTSVILGWEILRSDGATQSLSRFKSVEFKSQPDNIFQPPHATTIERSPAELNEPISLAELQKKVGFPLVLPRWLPPGFRSQGHYLTECEDDCHAPVALSRFTDGQNTLSLFQGRHVIEPAPTEHTGHSSTDGQRIARIVRNGTNYVLIGSLDAAQLQKVIQSVPSGKHPT